MRLIDADDLKALWEGISPKAMVYPASVIDTIKRAKTIKDNNHMHAHWYFDPDKSIGCGITVSGMFCSNCGSDCPTGSHPYRDFKYCPHCGAKMDEEENDGRDSRKDKRKSDYIRCFYESGFSLESQRI